MATSRKKNPTLVTAALKQQARGADNAPPAPAAVPKPPARGRETTRQGRVLVSAWLPIAARSSFLLIRAHHPEKRQQDLIEEAFNDLFAKYNVPQTAKAS
ncbi:MAG: hypothetical protein C5B58_10905 [Acidobacteria bacterium]|nr:MAG: hypothetical protein C5B58_10905 [Acidobacteriota bacterium]